MSVIPFEQRFCCTIPEACQAAGFGRSTLYELIQQGRIEARKVGARRLIVVASLRAFLESDLTKAA